MYGRVARGRRARAPACTDHTAERFVEAPVLGAHKRGEVSEREDRRAPERRVREVVEGGPLRVRYCAAGRRVV